MKCTFVALIILIYFSNSEMKITGGTETAKHKLVVHKPPLGKTTSTTAEPAPVISANRTIQNQKPQTATNPPKILIPKIRKHAPEMQHQTVLDWAKHISEEIVRVETNTVRRGVLLEKFKDIKIEERDGAAIVENIAAALEDLLERRVRAAEAIGREAEKLAAQAGKSDPPSDYVFKNSKGLDLLKKNITKSDIECGDCAFPLRPLPSNCSDKRPVAVQKLTHFGEEAMVQLDTSSVQFAAEVFECDPRVMSHLYWSEDLLHTFKQNYAHDAMMDFQYFCSVKGFLRHYPAATWDSMFALQFDDEDSPADVYDCRLRPWYVAAGGAPRDIVILFDFSGSMVNSSNKVHAEQFTLTLLTALTDDDQVNVLSFNNYWVESIIKCFQDMLVPANHINSAALMTMLKVHVIKNETNISWALQEAVNLLNKTRVQNDKPRSCQQAIVILSDSFNENYTLNMSLLDPTGSIRLFVIWLHDIDGLRDNSEIYGQQLACTVDGYFANLITDSDVTDQVMQVLRILERPLVHQRKERIRVFSDIYAHVEDPRRSDVYWNIKENKEQGFRYGQLRHDKKQFLSESQRYHDYMRFTSLAAVNRLQLTTRLDVDTGWIMSSVLVGREEASSTNIMTVRLLENTHGYYYEGTEKDYRHQISVSVPVFDDTRFENITITKSEELQRNATRTYPGNRLLGVAGVDIPIEHLKLVLPYYQLGAGGSLFIIDHRGNIVLHDNWKPVFDEDILRPGYRTVDLLDLEQAAHVHEAREYRVEWFQFREFVVRRPRDKQVLDAKYIFDHGLRAILGKREYHWKRVKEHYTVVVSLPTYNKRHAVPKGAFTQQLANASYSAFLTEMAVHPDWLYCKHVDQQFDERDCEVRHFVLRRRDEPNFKMQHLRHTFPQTPFPPKLLEKTYMCNEELMARLCKEAMATLQWADEGQNETAKRDCYDCELGSVTAFFAGESGLTRWQQYRMASGKPDPPPGSLWPRGPDESWYKRAVAARDKLVIHAPVTPVRKLRNSFKMPPPLSEKDKWYTAARTLGHHGKDMIGVAGYHFYPEHLENLLRITTTKFDEEEECEGEGCTPHCDNENWACVLIDEGGWILADTAHTRNELTEEEPVREHLARVYPHAMRALLDSKVFDINWIHDYQAVCFPPEKEHVKSLSHRLIPSSVMRMLWRSVSQMLRVTRDMMTVLALISTGKVVSGDTTLEKEKRRKSTRKSFERIKYEDLYDDRVLVNRTRFAACDRSRVLYVLQPNYLDQLKKPTKGCSWPVVGEEVPQTNLLLLGINLLCPDTGRKLIDPFINQRVDFPKSEYMTSAANLACSRNKVHLPVRSPPTKCFPHNYKDEEGYRQCGEWEPDPEPSSRARAHAPRTRLLAIFHLVWLHFKTKSLLL